MRMKLTYYNAYLGLMISGISGRSFTHRAEWKKKDGIAIALEIENLECLPRHKWKR